MTAYNFAYTIPFPENSRITQEQAFEALRIKCREPMKFVPIFASCEVLEETPTFIKRKAITKNGDVVAEDIDLYSPALVVFRAENGAYITNLISETATGGLLMTFTFSLPSLGDFIRGDEDDDEKKKKFRDSAKGAMGKSMETTLELLDEGKLN